MDEQKRQVMQATAGRIRYLRGLQHFSQEEVALRANLNPAYYGQVERGLKCPTVDTLQKIAGALDVPLPELLRFDGSSSLSGDASRLARMLARVPEGTREQLIQVLDGIIRLAWADD